RCEKMRNRVQRNRREANRCHEYQSPNARGMDKRESERDAAAERMAKNIRALETASVHDLAKVTDQGRRFIIVASNRLVGEAVATHVECQSPAPGPRQRLECEPERVDTGAPAVDEHDRRAGDSAS